MMKLFFIGSSAYTLYLMRVRFRPTQDASLDTFRLEYLLPPVAILSLVFTYAYDPTELAWAFSIWLESVAILPQLFMLQRTGEAETITTHYLAALGLYRGLYIPNWMYRYFTEGAFDPIAVIAGLIQTAIYADFGYIYVTKVLRGQKFELPA
ncbi:ER lumen protein retaining receptor [Tremella mesenterica]|uniref:ER lumen protein-retaining receptor n=2 Tax=Tremella mesenterica TaxID=5217 RepID=A0A4Q1BND5_TREME|nr:ER lumen protein retaining receptor [Tremella mesenterica]